MASRARISFLGLRNDHAERSEIFSHFTGAAGWLIFLDGAADRAAVVVFGVDVVCLAFAVPITEGEFEIAALVGLDGRDDARPSTERTAAKGRLASFLVSLAAATAAFGAAKRALHRRWMVDHLIVQFRYLLVRNR